MNPSSPAPRLADVARLAGVSLATASRVLNGSTRKVAESYQERVHKAAEELGYTANLSAQATARGTAAIIALLVADIADPYFANIASGVARKADEAGLVVTIAVTNRDGAKEAALLQTLRGQRPRAVILASSRSDEPIAEAATQLIASGSTVVALGPEMDPRVRWAGVDNRGGAEALGVSMAELGYRRAVIVAADEGIRTSDDRIDGFTTGFNAGGGEVAMIRRTAFDREGGEQAMARLASEGHVGGDHEPTLVFAVSDVMAIGALRAVRAAGLKIGEHVGLCGFDDITTAIDVTPELTTVYIPLAELGYQAAALAIDSDQELPDLPLTVTVRASTPRVIPAK